MKGGWFVGNFEPSVFKTKNFEVGYLEHKKGDLWDKASDYWETLQSDDNAVYDRIVKMNAAESNILKIIS